MNGKLNNTMIPIILLVVCGVVSLTYSYFLSFTERGLPVNDPFNILINCAWLAVLVWIGLDIYRKKPIEKTLLFLSFLVFAFTLFDYFDEEVSSTLFVLSAFESGLLFLIYFILAKIKKSNIVTDDETQN
jgi:hypothetical protein